MPSSALGGHGHSDLSDMPCIPVCLSVSHAWHVRCQAGLRAPPALGTATHGVGPPPRVVTLIFRAGSGCRRPAVGSRPTLHPTAEGAAPACGLYLSSSPLYQCGCSQRSTDGRGGSTPEYAYIQGDGGRPPRSASRGTRRVTAPACGRSPLPPFFRPQPNGPR